jgi:hypothetical protein
MAAPFPFRQPISRYTEGGVAVDLKRGTPSMRLFKANQPAQSEADRARDLRLTSIASRYRVRPEAAPQPEKSE